MAATSQGSERPFGIIKPMRMIVDSKQMSESKSLAPSPSKKMFPGTVSSSFVKFTEKDYKPWPAPEVKKTRRITNMSLR